MGAWIERNHEPGVIVHRISAQRALDIPDYASLRSLEQSQNSLLWGNENPQFANETYKWGHRWGNRPETFMQNDFEKMLSNLFAKTAERDRKHTEDTRIQGCYVEVPDSPIDILITLWKELLPHRNIVLTDGKVSVIETNTSAEYHGKEMSDGERVALYLMGQCLCIPDGSIIIIDEPEIHLHTSIIQSLWDKLEELRPTCLFVYITHDLHFASTRVNTANIWVKSFNGQATWSWEFVPEVEGFHESLLLELLGNRRTIIFIEGEKGGKDHAIYQSIFRNYLVVPRNGCQTVIESVRALRSNAAFHHLSVYGVIDRDFRSDTEIQQLAESGVFTIDVAEIENIFLNQDTLNYIAEHQHLNKEAILSRSIQFARKELENDIERQASLRTCRAIEFNLHKFDAKSIGLPNIQQSIQEHILKLDVESIYNNNLGLYKQLSTSGNIDDIIKHYNNKGLLPNINSIFELGKNGYEKLVLRLLNSDKREHIVAGLSKYVPAI